MKKAVSGIVLMLLLTSMLTLAVNILPVKAKGTIIYIRADGSVDPLDAPILNAGNLYYTLTADIYDCDVVVEKDNIVVDGAGYTIKGTGVGAVINITNRNSVAIKNVKIQDSMFGICLEFSTNIELSGNTITDTGIGIYLSDFSIANVLLENIITNNAYASIMLDSNSLTNSISGNYIASNGGDGIFLGSSSNNTISGNTIENNDRGIGLGDSSNNLIYHNNFINNSYHATTNGSINIWDSGYPSGGNYWSDYQYRYPNATEFDGSGIWNIPYVIDKNNIDHYPLMNPFGSLPPPPTPTPPVASFTWAPRSPIVGVTVTFDASGSYDPDGNITAYMWDFGDGTSAQGAVVTHAYAVGGSYTVALTVIDNDGANTTSKVKMNVLNLAVASFSWAPSLPLVNEMVIFLAKNDYPYGEVKYIWGFGDGDGDFGEGWTTHCYTKTGTYTVTLMVISISNNTVLSFAQQELQVASWTGIYNRGAAYNYAQKYWNTVCSDGYFWEDIWRPTPLPNGTNILGMEGCDGAHFVSCCIGRERYEHGGMLPVPGQSDQPYGYNNAMRLYGWLIQEGWAKEQPSIDKLKRGDVILYTRVTIDGGESQMAVYLGEGKVAAHTPSVWGADWHLGGEWDEYRFIHIIIPPVARFTYSPLNPLTSETVTFDAISSYDLDGTIVSYKWNFGDGTTATGRKVTHSYPQDGSYTVKLTVTDDNGNINSKSQTITVLNKPPVAGFTYSPKNPTVNQKVTFDASSSYDPDGKIVSYKWNFGDSSTGTGKIVTHTYSKAGQFTVKLTVTDNDGKSVSTSKTVTVVKPTDGRIENAIKWALNWTDGPPYPPGGPHADEMYIGWCLAFVQDAYQFGAKASIKRYGSAREAWQALSPLNPGIPPRGAFVFYDVTSGSLANYDHVGLSLGGGKMVHAHWHRGPEVTRYDANLASNVKYIGWAWPPLKPPIQTSGLSGTTTCPVDLVVIDPDGLIITKEFSQILEAVYLEEDFNGDGSLDDYVYIPEQKIGEYLITVVPEPDADPAATYTLEVSTGDATFLLAENVPISDMPEEPYVLDSTTFDTPPVTLLTIGEPQYTDPLNNIYVSSETSFNLTAEDNLGGSGVMATSYKIYNYTYSTDWLTYEEPFNLTQFTDGLYFIDFNSTDYAGNVEPTNTVAIILDNTPPTTTLLIGDPEYISDTIYVTPDTPFTLEATDSGSGIYSTAYRIHNATYDSSWLTYSAPFYLTSLADGIYTIEYNSTDNIGNVETTHATSVTLFSWNYVFTDSYGRGTTLKINTIHKFFQFITPDKDYGIRKATYMHVYNRAIIICHKDNELKLATVSVDTKLDFCIAYAKDIQTGKEYWLIDKVGTEN